MSLCTLACIGRCDMTRAAYGEKARGYLHGEISVLLEIPPDKVEDHISAVVSSESWRFFIKTESGPQESGKPDVSDALAFRIRRAFLLRA